MGGTSMTIRSDGRLHGFFIEWDCGTMSARDTAKNYPPTQTVVTVATSIASDDADRDDQRS